MTDMFKDLAAGLREAVATDWRALARPAQLPPAEFAIWLMMMGRGAGKNWAAAHYVNELAASGAMKRIALIAATAADVRFTIVEGVSGILTLARSWERPNYEPGKAQLTWPSGTIARLYSADQPESLRGGEFDLAWCDEVGAWRRADETWSNLTFAMRGGREPRIIITTTPRPTKLLRDLAAREGKDGIVITRSTTYDNRARLPPSFFAQLVKKFEGTRIGRQELLAELLTDTPGALWTVQRLEDTRVSAAPAAPLQRVVVAVDPSGSGSEGADECGIIVAGLGQDGEGYVLADLSGRMSPAEWARRAIDAYHLYRCDRLVAEVNYGGLMVAATIAAVDKSVPVKTITSSRGKVLRAEPVAAFFEQARAHLVGSFPELEDQLTSFTSDYDRARQGSPDRLDAAVFALTELMCEQVVGGYFREAALLVEGEPVEPVGRTGRPTRIYATVATGEGAGSAVGLVYWAFSPHYGYTLRALDYELVEIEEALTPAWLMRVFARAQELRVEWDAAETLTCVWCEEGELYRALGAVLRSYLMQALPVQRPPYDLLRIESRKLPPSLDDRASKIRAPVNGGACVKAARSAWERHTTHRNETANHLREQVLGYWPGAKDPTAKDAAQELMAAFCLGAVRWLDGRRPRASDVDAAAVPPPIATQVLPAPAPPRPRAPAQPMALLKPGRRIIDGHAVDVPPAPDGRALVWFPLAAGFHIIDGIGVRVDDPRASIHLVGVV